MKRLSIISVLLFAITFNGMAQIADSAFLRASVKKPEFKATELIVPGTLIATGVAVHFAAHETIDGQFRNLAYEWRGNRPCIDYDDYLRFLPNAMHLALGLCGAEAEHRFFNRCIETGWSYASIAAIGYTTKALLYSPRPNGDGRSSFPSGHACVAFSGAELVRMEYGNAWGAGAYAIAGGVAAMRLYNDEHWLSDLICGAGIGILSARIGVWLTDLEILGPIQKWLNSK